MKKINSNNVKQNIGRVLFYTGLLALALVANSGCGQSSTQQIQAPSVSPLEDTNFTGEELAKGLNRAAKMLVERLPTVEEYNNASKSLAEYEKVVRGYMQTAAFRTAMTSYHTDFFEMGGLDATTRVNYNEPRNLAVYIILNNLDYREVLRAKYCVDDNMNQVNCSTFNTTFSDNNTYVQATADQHAAGVLTTRAFLAKWAGPFNFRRVKHAFQNFACKEYPDSDDTGMTMSEIEVSLKDFRKTTVDATPACYSCHNTVNARASVFYNYNNTGNAIGLFNTNTTVTTRRDTPENSSTSDLLVGGANLMSATAGNGAIVPRYHGKTIQNLQQYGLHLSDSEAFAHCAVQRFSNYMIGNKPYDKMPSNLDYLVDKFKKNYNIQDLLVEIAKSPYFINK